MFVDEEGPLRNSYIENIKLAMEGLLGSDVDFDPCSRVEDARRQLTSHKGRYDVIFVDMLWPSLTGATERLEPRGLELITWAHANYSNAIVVAITQGDLDNYPNILDQAMSKGAHISKSRGQIQSTELGNGWDRLALEIVALNSNSKEGDVMAESSGSARQCFIVCGRDVRLNRDFFAFLRAINLEPREFEQVIGDFARDEGGGGSPDIFDVIRFGFRTSYAAIVLLSPDEEARLRPALEIDDSAEDPGAQPRPNVLIEAGYALRHRSERTILVQVGKLRGASDLSGMHILRLDNSASARKRLAERLRNLGLEVRTDGDDWLGTGDLSPS